MKQQKIFAYYFFPIIYVIFAGVVAAGLGTAVILDYYVYNDLTLIKSELTMMVAFLLALMLGLFLIFRDKVLITKDCCIEKLYNKTVKEIDVNKIKRIIVTQTPFTRSANVKRKSIVIDDGTFRVEDLPLNNYHFCPRSVSWIIMDYSTKRLKNIKEILLEVPVEWMTH